MITDTGPWPGTERDVLPSVYLADLVRAEPVGIELQRVVPQRRITLHAKDAHQHHAAGLYPVAVDRNVAHGGASPNGYRRAETQGFGDHLPGVSQLGHIIGG